MRKSSAPSLIKKTALGFSGTSAQNDVLRSTDSILNILKSANTATPELKSIECSTNLKEDENPPKNRLKQEPINPNVPATKQMFSVVYGKPSKKKHKTFEKDGILIVGQKSAVLKDDNGKIIGSTAVKSKIFETGGQYIVGNEEIEIIEETEVDFTIGKNGDTAEPEAKRICSKPITVSQKIRGPLKTEKSTPSNFNLDVEDINFDEETIEIEIPAEYKNLDKSVGAESIRNSQPAASDEILKERTFKIVHTKATQKKHITWDGDGTMIVNNKFATIKDDNGKVIGSIPTKSKVFEPGIRVYVGGELVEIIEEDFGEDCSLKPVIKPVSFVRKSCFKKNSSVVIPEESLVLSEPPSEHQLNFNKENLPITAVFVEPWLVKNLRKHQKVGINFLYECLMGYRESYITGAILADEMGLGKTLQTIALIWTILKHGPYGGKLIADRILIVTPSSLVDNWALEFKKWIGDYRLKPFIVGAKNLPQRFHINERVMIISYEMFVRYFEQIKDLGFDTLICDEGHRIKNSECRASKLLRELCIDKKIVLTGTPFQNDLLEFFALIDFVNPNIVGNISRFRNYFVEPIVASKQPDCSEVIKELGEERAEELNQIVSQFILRRTQQILDEFLPPKQELIVFCKPTNLQISVYNAIISELVDYSLGMEGSLGVISSLRKVCTHPQLQSRLDLDKEELKITQDINFNDSGKLMVVVNLLENLKNSKSMEKIVLVSNFTQTLDILEELCKRKQYTWIRLDGATASNQRSQIVSKFNTDRNQFVFLLSAKAGGVGLNLTGASRLVLFDSDWNPATDLQAMARIWRDGQKRNVFIYRLLTTGTIDEKIYQRQMNKQSLSNGIVDAFSSRSINLSQEEIRDIFAPCDTMDDCCTHISLNCDCDGSGLVLETLPTSNPIRACQIVEPNQLNIEQSNTILKMNELLHWQHFKSPIDGIALKDWQLVNCEEIITFVFKNSC